MPLAHRDTDARSCGAATTVVEQSTVFCNGKLWAVKGDINTHGGGQLIDTAGHTVFCEGKPVIVKGDLAEIDGAGHVAGDDAALATSDNVYAYGG